MNYYIISKIPYNKVLKISIINSIVHITNMIEYNGYNIQFLTNENKTNLQIRRLQYVSTKLYKVLKLEIVGLKTIRLGEIPRRVNEVSIIYSIFLILPVVMHKYYQIYQCTHALNSLPLRTLGFLQQFSPLPTMSKSNENFPPIFTNSFKYTLIFMESTTETLQINLFKYSTFLKSTMATNISCLCPNQSLITPNYLRV